MIRKATITLLAGVLAAAAQAPNLQLMDLVLRAVPDGPVAQVNGRPISADAFRDLYTGEVLRWHQENGKQEPGEGVRIGIALNSLRLLIDGEILFQEAQRRGITVTPAQLEERWKRELEQLRNAAKKDGSESLTEEAVLQRANTTREEALNELRRVMLVEAMRDQLLREKGITVTEDEVDAWLAENRPATQRSDLIHLKQIYIRAGKERRTKEREAAARRAEDAYNRIRSGQSFEGVAKLLSDGQFKDQGGDWGLRPVSYFKDSPFILEAVAKMKPGDVSPPIESDYGFHILKLVETVKADEASLPEDIRPKVREMLLRKKSGEVVREFTANIIQDEEKVRVYLNLEKEISARPELLERFQREFGQGAQPPQAQENAPRRASARPS